MNILETIKTYKDKFSSSELKVYNYILENPEAVEKYTITKLANLCDTSTSAVLRFCHTLGYSGYKDFKFEMIQYLQNNINTDDTDYFDRYLSSYTNNLNQLKNIDKALLNKLIQDIKSKHIYILGNYYSSLPAKHLSMCLRDLNIKNTYMDSYTEASHYLDIINENDILLIYSIDGEKSDYQKYLSSLNNKSYLITLNPQAPLSKILTYTLIIPGYSMNRHSIIDHESLFMIFNEILINMIRK